MAVKHVKDYFIQVANDYKRMTDTLFELEKTISEESSKEALQNINNIKHMVEKMKENYMRISYIMFLLNQPNKDSKKDSYITREHKWLDYIGKENTLDGVLLEDSKIISNIEDLK